MYLFLRPAPDLQIEVLDAKHKGEHFLFVNKQKEHNFYLSQQNQVILEMLKQIKIGTSVPVELHGVGCMPYNEVLCIFYFALFFLAVIRLKGLYHLHLRHTLPNLHNDSFLCAHTMTNPPTREGKVPCAEDAATPRNQDNPG